MPPYVPLSPIPPQIQDATTSTNMSGGSFEFYLAGTTTPTNLFSDDSGTSIGSTITLNSGGYPESGGNVITLFRDAEVDIKIICKNATGGTVWTADNLDRLDASAIQVSSSVLLSTDAESALEEAKGDFKVKDAPTAKSEDTTLADDPDLSGWTLNTGSHYAIEGYLGYLQNVGDIQWTFQFSNTPTSPNYRYIAVDTGSNEVTDVSNLDSTVSITTLTDNAGAHVHIIGGFQANASSGGTMDFQWAQNSSNINDTTLLESSWIRLTRLN